MCHRARMPRTAGATVPMRRVKAPPGGAACLQSGSRRGEVRSVWAPRADRSTRRSCPGAPVLRIVVPKPGIEPGRGCPQRFLSAPSSVRGRPLRQSREPLLSTNRTVDRGPPARRRPPRLVPRWYRVGTRPRGPPAGCPTTRQDGPGAARRAGGALSPHTGCYRVATALPVPAPGSPTAPERATRSREAGRGCSLPSHWLRAVTGRRGRAGDDPGSGRPVRAVATGPHLHLGSSARRRPALDATQRRGRSTGRVTRAPAPARPSARRSRARRTSRRRCRSG